MTKRNHKSHRSTPSCSHIHKSHKKTKFQVTIYTNTPRHISCSSCWPTYTDCTVFWCVCMLGGMCMCFYLVTVTVCTICLFLFSSGVLLFWFWRFCCYTRFYLFYKKELKVGWVWRSEPGSKLERGKIYLKSI